MLHRYFWVCRRQGEEKLSRIGRYIKETTKQVERHDDCTEPGRLVAGYGQSEQEREGSLVIKICLLTRSA